MSNIIIHLELIFRAILYVPLIKISILCLQSVENNSKYIISLINLVLFFAIIFPFSLLISFNTFVFINKKDSILKFICLNLLFNIFKIIVALVHPFGSNNLISPIIIFIVFYSFVTIKQPISYYSNDSISQHSISWICFICIYYLI